jgi:curved DNA-binding protein CbpA
MNDPYLVLGLVRTLYVDPQVIDQSFRTLAAMHHPDRAGGCSATFQQIQEAAALLRDPAKRLRYLAGASERHTTSPPAAAMELFSTIVTCLQESDALLKKYQAALGLTRALMIGRLLEQRRVLDQAIQQVEVWHERLLQRLRDLDQSEEEPSSQELLELATSFSFVQRWEQQLAERSLTFTTMKITL